jgi:hypothetical protein
LGRLKSVAHAISETAAWRKPYACVWSTCGKSIHFRSCRAAALAPVDHARGRGCRKCLGDCRLVPGALDHRTTVPGDEIARAAAGGQPTGVRRPFGQTCRGGDKSRLYRYATGAGTQRQPSVARFNRLLGAGGSKPSRRWFSYWKERPNGRRTHTQLEALHAQVGSSPDSLAS